MQLLLGQRTSQLMKDCDRSSSHVLDVPSLLSHKWIHWQELQTPDKQKVFTSLTSPKFFFISSFDDNLVQLDNGGEKPWPLVSEQTPVLLW